MRDNTERPETLIVGLNILAECDPVEIIKSVDLMGNKQTLGKFYQQPFKKSLIEHASLNNNWKYPYGGGTSSIKIMDVLKEGKLWIQDCMEKNGRG